jgi:hypothetical protein
MSGSASVAAIGAPSGISAARAVASAVSVRFAQAVKAPSKASKNPTVQTAVSVPAPATAGANLLPLGLLLSVSRPPSTNATAGSDYAALQEALRTDNLGAARQAYLRLQSDLQVTTTGATTRTAPARP